MREHIRNILVYLLNKIDPMIISHVSIRRDKIELGLGKDFYTLNQWHHVAFTGDAWIKVSDKGGETRQIIHDLTVYKDGEIAYKYTFPAGIPLTNN